MNNQIEKMQNYETFKIILKEIETKINKSVRDFKRQHCDEIQSTDEKIADAIFLEIENREKQQKKNLKKIKEIEEFLTSWLLHE